EPPTTSGNDVVAAAQIAPVGWNDSAWSTRPLWCTRSRHGPSYAWCRSDHDCHADTVSSSRVAISSWLHVQDVDGSGRRAWCNAKPARAPARRTTVPDADDEPTSSGCGHDRTRTSAPPV